MTSESTTQPSSEEDTLSRAEYFAERKLLIEARSRSYQRLEQMISAGAAATLVFSISYPDKLIQQPRPGDSRLILAAWVALLLSLGLSLASQVFSGAAFGYELKALDGRATQPNPWARSSSFASWTAAILFVVGIGFLAWVSYRSRY
jgi:hypothetical protein